MGKKEDQAAAQAAAADAAAQQVESHGDRISALEARIEKLEQLLGSALGISVA